jgi:hypothetical protein
MSRIKIVLYVVLLLPVCWWLYRNIVGTEGLDLLPYSTVTSLDAIAEPYTRVTTVASMCWFVFLFLRSHKKVRDLSKPQELVPIRKGYGIPATVPHGRYDSLENGFRATLPQRSTDGLLIGTLLLFFGVPTAGIFYAINGLTTGLLVGIAVGIGTGCACFMAKPPATIEVVGDTIFIDSAVDIPPLELDHFKHFTVWHRDSGRTIHKFVGFQYGHQVYAFGGYWHVTEAEEIAAALNIHLNRHRDGQSLVGSSTPEHPTKPPMRSKF